MKKDTLYSIQYLRFFAALLVIHAHSVDLGLAIGQGKSYLGESFALANFGAIGVDVFFVISGFIFGFLREKETKLTIFQFYLKRALRILPFYYAWSLLWYAQLEHPISAYAFEHLWNNFLFLPYQDHLAPPLHTIGWTLCFEIYFYLLYPLINKIKTPLIKWQFPLFLTLLVLVFQVFNLPGKHFYGSPLLLEFALGYCIANFFKDTTMPFKYWLTGAFLAFEFIHWQIYNGFGYISEDHWILQGNDQWMRFYYWGIPCALLVGFLLSLEKRHLFKGNRLLLTLGNASFTAYIAQNCLFALIKKTNMLSWTTNKDIILLFSILFIETFAVLIYLKIEQPIYYFLNKKFLK